MGRDRMTYARPDGRTPTALRPITINVGVSKFAEGSAEISFGDTKVLCLATLQESVPKFLDGKGTGWSLDCKAAVRAPVFAGEEGLVLARCADRLDHFGLAGPEQHFGRVSGCDDGERGAPGARADHGKPRIGRGPVIMRGGGRAHGTVQVFAD